MASSRPRKKLLVAPKEAGNGSYRESWRGEAGEMYRALAEELDGQSPTVTARQILNMMEPRAVALAEAYAERSHQRWPPKPTRSGWKVQIISFAPYD